MCDLYLAAYSATEPYLTSRVKDRAGNESLPSEKIISNPGTASSTSTGGNMIDMDGNTTHTLVPPSASAPSESESELVVALLGGALQSLLESRFAFTPAVAERSKYRSQIIALAVDIARRLGCVLMKVLRAHSKGYVPCTPHVQHQHQKISKQSTTSRPKCQVQDPGTSNPATVNTSDTDDGDGDGNGTIFPTPLMSPLSDVENGTDSSDGDKKEEAVKKCSRAVLEAKTICVELLKWSITKPTSPVKAEDTDSGEGATVSMASAGPTEPSSPSVLQGTTGEAGAAPAPAAAISIARLFELIDMVNQNEWLRSCANSNK